MKNLGTVIVEVKSSGEVRISTHDGTFDVTSAMVGFDQAERKGDEAYSEDDQFAPVDPEVKGNFLGGSGAPEAQASPKQTVAFRQDGPLTRIVRAWLVGHVAAHAGVSNKVAADAVAQV